MNTIIIPGFSLKNKDWAEDIQKNLNPITPTSIVYWQHWETGKTEDNWIGKEAQKIVRKLNDQKVNILAKSIGSCVSMIILKQKPELINKIILCGVPLRDFHEGDEKYFEPLKIIPSEKIICIQNVDDNHGSYKEVEQFLHSLNPNLAVIFKPRSDHDYPYSGDFIDFLII